LGAVIADGLAGVATGMLLFALLRRDVPTLRYPVRLVLKIVAASFGALATAYFTVPPAELATTVASMVLSGTLFVALCYVLKPLAREDLPLQRLGPRVGQVAHWFGAPAETNAI
jgi:peptidoglycan/LPS O-acetylase OafA/YrhL